LFERTPQPAGLHAHDRVSLRIEIGIAAEPVGRDRIGFEPVAAAGQSLFDNEDQEVRKLRRLRQNGVRDHAAQRGTDILVARLLCFVASLSSHIFLGATPSLHRRGHPPVSPPEPYTVIIANIPSQVVFR